MANPRVEATYARAMAAFQEGSFDVARRLIGEILIDDPGHAGARALRTRLEARMSSAASGRSGYTPTPGSIRPPQAGRGNVPEATSVDPTILIDRASSTFQPPEYIEPTVVVQRDDLQRRREAAAPPPPPPPHYSRPSRSEPAPEPTMMIPPKRSTASASSDGGRSGGLLDRVKDLAGASSPRARQSPSRSARQPGGFWTPTTRGAAMAVGGVVVAAILIVAVVALVRWLWPGGYVLTVARPLGGTIVGSGFQCGTRGSDCELTKAADDTVELKPVPDSGYVFSGFTGDCAPSGRVLMTKDKSCGATFGAVTAGGPADSGGARAWTLTIEKPTGGTIVGDGGISCGTLGSTCNAQIPDGTPVVLTFQSDKDYQFMQFTGDCGAEGKFTMTGAKTCGASFAPTPTPIAVSRPRATPPSAGTSRPASAAPSSAGGGGGQAGSQPSLPTTAAPPSAQNAAPAPSGQPGSPGSQSGSGSPPAVSGPTGTVSSSTGVNEKPPEVTITPEAHARREIGQLVKDYCAAMDTLQPDRLKKLYPQVDMAFHREAFRQYKSLKCSLVGDPEYDRLDASSAGGAQLKIGMKQQVEMKTGGAPKVLETIATFVVSRMSNQSPWLIDRLQHVPKPK
jgi:Divergent InlB B-repeat domain